MSWRWRLGVNKEHVKLWAGQHAACVQNKRLIRLAPGMRAGLRSNRLPRWFHMFAEGPSDKFKLYTRKEWKKLPVA